MQELWKQNDLPRLLKRSRIKEGGTCGWYLPLDRFCMPLDSGQDEYESPNVLISARDARSHEELELKGLDVNKVGTAGCHGVH